MPAPTHAPIVGNSTQYSMKSAHHNEAFIARHGILDVSGAARPIVRRQNLQPPRLQVTDFSNLKLWPPAVRMIDMSHPARITSSAVRVAFIHHV